MLEIPPDLDVAEKAEPGLRGDLLERLRDGLQLRMVGRDTEPNEPPRRGQPLEHVDLDRRVSRQQRARGIEARRARTDNGDA